MMDRLKKRLKELHVKLTPFLWRLWNSFKTSILPVAASVILLRLQSTPDSLTALLSKDLWVSVGYAVIVSLLAGVVAGIDKMRRV